MRPRSFTQDRSGVAAALGAILIAGILFSVYITVQTQYVPVWEKHAEAEHMDRATERFQDLRSLVDGTDGTSQDTGGTRSIPLTPAKTLLGTTPVSHSVSFQPETSRVETHAKGLVSIAQGSRDLFDEAWGPYPIVVEEVMTVHNLRFRFDEIGGQWQDGQWARFTLRAADGSTLGNFEARQTAQPPERHLEITVQDATGDVIYSNPESLFIAHTVSPYWVDALEPKYRFSGTIEKAQKPIHIEVTGDLQGSFAINYENVTGFHGATPSPHTANSTFNLEQDCGKLVYRGENARLMRQDLILEHGAVVLQQSDGSAFRVPPLFSIKHNPQWTTVDVGVHCLTGRPASHSATDQANVELVPDDKRTAWGFTESFRFNVTTSNPELWMDHWRHSLESSGLRSGLNYTIAPDPSGDTLRLHLWATDPDELDIRINLIQTTYRVTIRS